VALSSVAGVLSRYFIVGFYLPAFFALALLDQTVPYRSQPTGYRDLSGGTQILVIGGVALLLGLLLSGLHTSLLTTLEGWPLFFARRSAVGGFVYRLIGRRQIRGYGDCCKALKEEKDEERRTQKAQTLFSRFSARVGPDGEVLPADKAEVLPTAFGNVRRAAETHPRRRYGLDGVAIRPSVTLLLSDGERQQLADAEGDVAFFANGVVLVLAVAALLLGSIVAGDDLVGGWLSSVVIVLVAAAVVGFVLMHGGTVVSRERWGPLLRAAFDVHRLEVYDRMGVRHPISPGEDLRFGDAVNRCLVYAADIPAYMRAKPTEKEE
jgi:hypothetical protein